MNKWMPVFLSLLTIAASGQNTYNLTPKPKILIEKEGHFLLPVRPMIAVAGTDVELRKLVEAFAEQMGKVSGYDTKVFAGNFRIKNGINFVISKDAKLGTDGYFLEITPLRIVVTAEQINGFRGGLTSLKKLMPPAIFGLQKIEGVVWQIPCCYIEGQTLH